MREHKTKVYKILFILFLCK